MIKKFIILLFIINFNEYFNLLYYVYPPKMCKKSFIIDLLTFKNIILYVIISIVKY